MKTYKMKKYLLIFLIIPSVLFGKATIDKVIVNKTTQQMFLMQKNKIIKTYKVALSSNKKGHKEKEGDKKTPEGVYKISGRHISSRFHRSIHISYPNKTDLANAKKRGYSAGLDIMIHGVPKSFEWLGGFHRLINWTHGCIAVTNDEIDEIWKLTPNNIPIKILP